MFILNTRTNTNNYNYNFLSEISATQTFFLCFHQLTKFIPLTPAVMTNGLLDQNVLRLSFVLSIVFITDFFPYLHAERFQSTEVKQFCLRLRVIGRSVGIIISHAVDAVLIKATKFKCKTYFSDIPLKY